MKLTVLILAAMLPLAACVLVPDHQRDGEQRGDDRGHRDDHERDHCDHDGHCDHQH